MVLLSTFTDSLHQTSMSIAISSIIFIQQVFHFRFRFPINCGYILAKWWLIVFFFPSFGLYNVELDSFPPFLALDYLLVYPYRLAMTIRGLHSRLYYILKTPNMLYGSLELVALGERWSFILRTEVITPRHGFAFAWFGRRTFSLGRGGRRIGTTLVEAPLGGIFTYVAGCSCDPA